MAKTFSVEVKELYERVNEFVDANTVLKANRLGDVFDFEVPEDFKIRFFQLVDRVNTSLMEEKDHFYGYFLFQMGKDISFDIPSPTGVNFKGAKYVIYFNPILFLNLNIKQMESTIKHEIYHVVSKHLVRAQELKGKYSRLAVNLAMDIVVNKYIDYLPPKAVTLESVNAKYQLKLKPYEPFEYYLGNIQNALDLMEEDEDEGEVEDGSEKEAVATAFDEEHTHDIWADSDVLDEKTIQEFTEKFISNASKGPLSSDLEKLIGAFHKSRGEVPWQVYLGRLMGTIETDKKKTITRRSRRQPERLDLRGQLRNHKAQVAVALDISGSISDEEFRQAMLEVLNIVKNYKHEITVIECDEQIRRVYKVKTIKDLKDRISVRGATSFTPVFDYANKQKFNMLVYFTDGKGEDKLKVIPRGYKTLWVISGRGEKLSLKESYGPVKKLAKVEAKSNFFDMSDVRSDGYSMTNQAPVF